ncbi:glycosyltransferase [Cohnella faecalis]|uniref:glycosyltransferase n=1 Tax=Cohnella faecalis TaxID=2315694 RepID=UPI0013143994|nr:glycosyltransferase [Cohnella faecalis]
MNKLSLLAVSFNQENTIERCLTSVKFIADELIVVDLGSTDRTKEIALSCGANVLDYSGNGLNSDAHNFGLELATGDWILHTSPDEYLDPQDRYKLRDALYEEDKELMLLPVVLHPSKDGTAAQGREFARTRLFRNGSGFRFTGKIHGMLNFEEKMASAEALNKFGSLAVRIHHAPTTGLLQKHKMKAAKNDPAPSIAKSPFTAYHMACECYRAHLHEEAVQHLNQSIRLFLDLGYRVPPSFLYKLKYHIFARYLTKNDSTRGLQAALRIYPDYAELHYDMGLICMSRQAYDKAVNHFNECLALGERQSEYLVQQGTGSYAAAYNLGLCLEKKGRYDEAVQSYHEAVRMRHSYSPPLHALNRVADKHRIDVISSLAEDARLSTEQLEALIKAAPVRAKDPLFN